jgi:hypothetical protein
MIEVLKQSAEDVSKVYDILAFGHTERALEILAKIRTSLRQAIAELESQEPFAYVNVEMRRLEFATDYVKWDTPTTIKLDKIPLYTHPPQRTWVGLTDEEVNNAIKEKNITPLFTYRMIARAIEAKLKEKNT